MTYDKKAQDKYRMKVKTYAVKYTPTDIMESKRLDYYLANSGISTNSYIKSLIKADLDVKGIQYPEDSMSNSDSD